MRSLEAVAVNVFALLGISGESLKCICLQTEGERNKKVGERLMLLLYSWRLVEL